MVVLCDWAMEFGINKEKDICKIGYTGHRKWRKNILAPS